MKYTIDSIINELSLNTSFKLDKPLTSGVIFYLRKHPKMLEDMKAITGLDNVSEGELLYNIVHPECSRTCIVCGNPVKFEAFYYGYKKTCCKKCANILTVQEGAKTKEERYGDAKYNNPEKNKNTLLERYGSTSYRNIEKAKATKLERYGDANYNNPQKNKETCLERYGVDNGAKTTKAREAVKRTNFIRRGVAYPMQSEAVKKVYKEAYEKKTGFKWPLGNLALRKAIAVGQMTSNEKIINEFLHNRGFIYEYQYYINGKNFDFAVFDSNNNLKILIESDGTYFHGLLSDPDGKEVRGETDCQRFSKVPEGVSFIVADAVRNKEEVFAEILRVFNLNYEEWVQSVINSMPENFPFQTFLEDRMKKDWDKLHTYKEYNKNQYLGTSIVKHFHPSIYRARVGNNKSPVEAWGDKSLLERCVRNRFIYSSKLSSHHIADGFNICKLAPKVSVFNPSLAKHILQTYCTQDTVFDPFSGFSGRMLGACCLGKKYIGQDINKDHVEESNNIIKFFELDAEVIQKDIFESHGGYPCLFTCSPYGLKEIWNESDVNKSCDEWIDECLDRFKCKEYIFVVDKTDKYKEYIVEELSNKSHFNSNKEYVVVIRL